MRRLLQIALIAVIVPTFVGCGPAKDILPDFGMMGSPIEVEKLGEDECPNPDEFPDKRIVGIANDVTKGKIYLKPSPGTDSQAHQFGLGETYAFGEINFYEIKGRLGEDLIQVGIEPAGGHPARLGDKIYWHHDRFLVGKGEVVFIHLRGDFTYNTVDSYTSPGPLDDTVIIKKIPERYCK